MPVWIDHGDYGETRQVRPFGPAPSDCLEIGFVNSMAGPASISAERQFIGLLQAAAGDTPIGLRLYGLQAAAERNLRPAEARYHHIGDLFERRHDGLIVTGKEPSGRSLTQEAHWPTFTAIVEWAQQNTASSIWSCLAAHAAVLHLDGIDRLPLDDKLSGVFEFSRTADHNLTQGLGTRVRFPHSRWNELAPAALASCGYRVLTHSETAGVDAFVRQSRSLFVFFQGHPEYEPETLLREYRRDVGRFLRGERHSYPSMPQNYFDERTCARLLAFQASAMSDARIEMLAGFPDAAPAAECRPAWRDAAARLYRNWMSYMMARKPRRGRPGFVRSSRKVVSTGPAYLLRSHPS